MRSAIGLKHVHRLLSVHIYISDHGWPENTTKASAALSDSTCAWQAGRSSHQRLVRLAAAGTEGPHCLHFIPSRVCLRCLEDSGGTLECQQAPAEPPGCDTRQAPPPNRSAEGPGELHCTGRVCSSFAQTQTSGCTMLLRWHPTLQGQYLSGVWRPAPCVLPWRCRLPLDNGCACSQVKLFSSQEHTSALMAGDVPVAIGWSDQMVPLADRSTNIALVAPQSGKLPFLQSLYKQWR